MASVLDTLSPGWSQTFGYDNLNRLTSASRYDNAYNHLYNYDSFGNMIVQDTLHYNPTYAIDPATNQLLMNPLGSGILDPYGHPANIFTYDFAGNMVSSGANTNGGHQYAYNPTGQVTGMDCANGACAAQYTYDASDQRVFKSTPSGWTNYVYFNGQPIAELTSTGAWTDYIYANGQKIAMVPQGDARIHTSGVFTSSNNELRWNLPIPQNTAGGGNYTVQAGDMFCFRQYNNNAIGGPLLAFSNGRWTAWDWADTAGEVLNQDTVQNQWLNRCTDMTMGGSTVGAQLTLVSLLTDVWTPPGAWDIWYADMSITSANGVVTTIIGAQPPTPQCCFFQGGNWTGTPVAYAETVPASSDPTNAAASGATTHYYLDDHLGTAQMELASGGWPLWQGQFTPFGAELPDGNTAMHYKFTGKERDTESGLDYFKYRMYASPMGRWMSPDPSGLTHADLGNPQSLNLYNYVGNSPLTRADLDGLCWKGFQWACNAAQALDNGVHGLGFQTNAKVDKEQHTANQLLHHDGISTEGLSRRQVRSAYKLDMALGSVRTGPFDSGLVRVTRTRPTAAQARSIWEKATGGKVPYDENLGRFYDMAHKTPIGDGGSPTDPNNLEPMLHSDHMDQHMQNGDFARWGAKGAGEPPDVIMEPAAPMPSPIIIEPIEPIP